ncbi:hypothetical protein [Parageobacillus thermoglucosidasius]|jgi:uncharacterized protein with PQ loop repeat|uniref:hypothetical protein n=1 Tax=Parageobacillus thermoglucosidasius TaxID=1426 RepID=UPI000B57047D|nr:hypothetical protein [Parageobacillus thermoglucosidasius]OUM90470.1 MAG: hypothetical protein BAA00_00315 [Parageobacillus thermoglucosidasius]
MRRIEWLISLILVAAGLTCLTVSGTLLMNPDSIHSYLHTLLQICMWSGIPFFVAGLVYFIIKWKRGDF